MRESVEIVEELSGRGLDVHYGETAAGDVRRTLADTSRIADRDRVGADGGPSRGPRRAWSRPSGAIVPAPSRATTEGAEAVRLAMTILVRDAEDLIETNLRYHRAQGVDLFLIGDNGSTDRTLEILEPYREAGLVELEHIEGDARQVWSEGRTMLARKAYELGADWVIHDDHDEFWWPLTGNPQGGAGRDPGALRARSRRPAPSSSPSRARSSGPSASRCASPASGGPRRSSTAPIRRCRIRQPHPSDIWIDDGTSPRDGLVGRPVRRAREAHSEATELELLLAPTFPIGVLHFPVRSLKQYTRLVGDRGRQRRPGPRRGHAQGPRRVPGGPARRDLRARWRSTTTRSAEGIEAGHLVEDTGFRDYLRACPDPLERGAGTGGAGRRPRLVATSGAEHELAELEADGMYTLSRYLQTIAYRRLSDRQLRAEARGAQERLEEIEATAWWRMRPRYGLVDQPAAAGHGRRCGGACGGQRHLGRPRRHAVKLAMTLIVRNEADVIEDNLRYHRAQGVDFFIVLDNGSTDGTLEILERYERAGHPEAGADVRPHAQGADGREPPRSAAWHTSWAPTG